MKDNLPDENVPIGNPDNSGQPRHLHPPLSLVHHSLQGQVINGILDLNTHKSNTFGMVQFQCCSELNHPEWNNACVWENTIPIGHYSQAPKHDIASF